MNERRACPVARPDLTEYLSIAAMATIVALALGLAIAGHAFPGAIVFLAAATRAPAWLAGIAIRVLRAWRDRASPRPPLARQRPRT